MHRNEVIDFTSLLALTHASLVWVYHKAVEGALSDGEKHGLHRKVPACCRSSIVGSIVQGVCHETVTQAGTPSWLVVSQTGNQIM